MSERIDAVRSLFPRFPWLGGVAIVSSVLAISLLHYVTSVHVILLHEIFQRLYYVPIVVAAVAYGSTGGLTTAIFSSFLYLPHLVLDWRGWPVFEVNKYGEIVLFNVVALVTGLLADRLHAERNRYRQAAEDLTEAYGQLQARIDERLRVDRLVTVGRLAEGVAHEIRNPLGGVLGCIEILESEFPRTHPKVEFFAIAKRELLRLESVASAFLDFAQPSPPTRQPVDLAQLVGATARLAGPALVVGNVTVAVDSAIGPAILADADAEQVERALLNLILNSAWAGGQRRIALRLVPQSTTARLLVEVRGVEAPEVPLAGIFEPFAGLQGRHGLALATARRLIENQHGTIRAELEDATLRFVIDLPRTARPFQAAEPVASRGTA